MTLRRNITINEEDCSIIDRYCKKLGKSFSEFLREAALNEINKAEELDLYNYLIKNVPFVSKQEQKEFEKLDIDFEEKGKELTLDDIL